MVASTSWYSSRSSNSIWMGCLTILAVFTVGLVAYLKIFAAYPFWPPMVPGAAEFDKGSARMAAGDLKGASEAFQAASDKNHYHALAVFHQARARQQLGEPEPAIAGYTEALRLHNEIAAMDREQREKLRPVPLGYQLAHAHLNRAPPCTMPAIQAMPSRILPRSWAWIQKMPMPFTAAARRIWQPTRRSRPLWT